MQGTFVSLTWSSRFIYGVDLVWFVPIILRVKRGAAKDPPSGFSRSDFQVQLTPRTFEQTPSHLIMGHPISPWCNKIRRVYLHVIWLVRSWVVACSKVPDWILRYLNDVLVTFFTLSILNLLVRYVFWQVFITVILDYTFWSDILAPSPNHVLSSNSV